MTKAQSWFDSIQNNTFKTNPSHITILSEDNTQDFLTYPPVPLPGSVWFLGLAMFGIGAAARKRQIG